jgi:HEPN domain-containing protein
MAKATTTLAQALDRAKAREPIAPTCQRIDVQLRASMSLATNTLARQAALKAAKAKLQAQGLRPSAISHRELVTRAEAYLAEHREELIADAKEIVERWQAEGVFGKRGGIHFTRK